jgi:uncharacterized membrane protein (UPF0127 family)
MSRELPTLTLLRSDGLPVVERCSVADTPTRRLRGLLGRPVLEEGEGMVLRPSWGIFTAFLPAPIDAIFLSNDQTVLRIVEGLKPFRYAGCRGARDVVEARAGTCRERLLDVGHSVTWAAYAPGVERDDLNSQPRPWPDETRKMDASAGKVVLCSADRDFLRLTRFLLEHHDVEVHTVGRAEQVIAVVAERRPNVLILDAGSRVAEIGRVLAAVDALHWDVEVVVVSDQPRSLPGFEVRDKWDVLDCLVDTVAGAAAAANGHGARNVVHE